MKFLLINNETFSSNFICDGIFGLGVNYNDERESILLKLVNENYIKSPVFSFYLSDSNRDSKLYFDDQSSNPNFVNIYKKMNYCEVVNKTIANNWQCNLNSVTFGNLTLNLNKTVVFETSTSFVIIPISDFNVIKPILTKNSLCTISIKKQLLCKCKSPDIYNNINLNLSNGTIILETKYLIDYEPYHEYQCRFQVLVDDNFDSYWIIGDSGLRGMYVTFDYNKKKIGFSKDRFFQETLQAEVHNEDVKIYYFIGIILIGFAMYSLFKWANEISLKNKEELIEKNNMILLEEK